MTPALLTLLNEVRIERQKHGRTLPAPATDDELQAVRIAAHQQLDYVLPTSYLEILAQCNGIDWNGFQLYATHEVMRTAANGMLLYERMGLVETNLIWREFPPNSEFVFLVESGEMLYGHHLASNKFMVVDRLTNEMDDEERDAFATCEELLERLFREMLNN